MDLDARRLLFDTEGRDGSTLGAFVEDLKAHGVAAEQILDACCDMSPAFLGGIQKHLPKAEVTLNRFHLMKLMNDALDAVRRSESPTTPGLKKARLRELKTMNLQAVETYQMKLLLQDFFEQPNRRAGATFLNDWCALAHTSGISPLMRVATTFQQHRRGILNWWRSQISNGLIEGTNSLIQAAIAKAGGYRNPLNLISIAYLIAGKLNINNPLLSRPSPT